MSTHLKDSMNLVKVSRWLRKTRRLSRWASQVVQSRRDVAHHCHQEERYLENVVGHEIQTLNHFIIPCHRVEVEDEGQKPEEDPNTDDLERMCKQVATHIE